MGLETPESFMLPDKIVEWPKRRGANFPFSLPWWPAQTAPRLKISAAVFVAAMASPWPADLNNGYTGFSSSCSSELTNLSTEAPSDVGSSARPALRPLLYGTERPMRDPAARVHWDEECIAEHDKDRGTRQKIDEPDTPFVRSPTVSDDEEEKSASAPRLRAIGAPPEPHAEPRELPAERGTEAVEVAKPRPRVQLPVAEEEGDERRTLSPDAMEMLTDRLNEWVEIGSPQSQGRRCSKEEEKSDRSEDSSRRVSIVQVGESKSSSSNFKAQRAKHYNEFAAMKALKQQKFDSDSSAASDTSDEEALQRKQKKKGVKVETRKAEDGDHQGELNSSSKDEWRTKRNAHYRDMAAAFRSNARQEKDSDSD
eukprot:s216_g40.t2